jgi:hypothetical protein
MKRRFPTFVSITIVINLPITTRIKKKKIMKKIIYLNEIERFREFIVECL